MRAIIKREFNSYFFSPVGYVFLGIYFFFSGFFFRNLILLYGVADFYNLFSYVFLIYLFAIPILTMRLMADEKRQKTDQLLFSAPISLLKIILGKYLAAFFMLLIANSIFILYGLTVSTMAELDWASLLNGILGSLLLGGALTAIGLFVSSLTESQVVSAILTFAISLILFFIDALEVGESVAANFFISWLSLGARFSPFMMGVFDPVNVFYYVSMIAVFIFLTVRIQENKRWR